MCGADAEFTSDDRELLKYSVRGLLKRHWPAGQAQALSARPAEVRRGYELLAGKGRSALSAEATLCENADAVPLGGRTGQLLLRSIMMAVGGGSAQIQCNLMAQRGVGLPR